MLHVELNFKGVLIFKTFSMHYVGRDKQLVLLLTQKAGSTSADHFCEIRVSPSDLAEDCILLGSITPCQLANICQCFEEPWCLYTGWRTKNRPAVS